MHRPSLLQARMRRSADAGRGRRRLGMVLLVLMLAALAVSVAWFSLSVAGRFFFTENNLFAVRAVRIDCPAVHVTAAQIMDYLPIRVHDNIFSAGLRDVESVLRLNLPRLKDVQLSRRLPDLLLVRVTERVPVARLRMDRYMLSMDAEGYVLGRAPHDCRLPVITGHSPLGLLPGMRLDGTHVMPAVDLLNACAALPLGRELRITRIDVSDVDRLELLLDDGTEVVFAWRDMRARTLEARGSLKNKLDELARIRRHPRKFSRLDMTLENNYPAH